jgi:hypothetical protein
MTQQDYENDDQLNKLLQGAGLWIKESFYSTIRAISISDHSQLLENSMLK